MYEHNNTINYKLKDNNYECLVKYYIQWHYNAYGYPLNHNFKSTEATLHSIVILNTTEYSVALLL